MERRERTKEGRKENLFSNYFFALTLAYVYYVGNIVNRIVFSTNYRQTRPISTETRYHLLTPFSWQTKSVRKKGKNPQEKKLKNPQADFLNSEIKQ